MKLKPTSFVIVSLYPVDFYATDFTISAKVLFAEAVPFLRSCFCILNLYDADPLTFYPSNTESEIRYSDAVVVLLLPYI